MIPSRLRALLVTADARLSERLAAEVARLRGGPEVTVASTLAHARRRLEMLTPSVIFLDGAIVQAEPLEALVRELGRSAPLVAAIHPSGQADLAYLVSMGEVDCVAHAGDFLPLALALVERRLRWAEYGNQYEDLLAGEEFLDFGSMFRHELNNPLTGILGNAELLLRQRQKLSPDAVLRLETIADLAVRLRETIRRISNAWESRHGHVGRV